MSENVTFEIDRFLNHFFIKIYSIITKFNLVSVFTVEGEKYCFLKGCWCNFL